MDVFHSPSTPATTPTKKKFQIEKTTFMDMEEQNATLFRLSLTLVYILLSPREN